MRYSKSPKKQIIKLTENEVKRTIIDYLAARKVLYIRNNSGAFSGEYKGKKRFFRFGDPGSPDILWWHNGTFGAIEAKATGKKPSDEQMTWGRRLTSVGGVWYWTDDPNFFIEWFETHFGKVRK